jgi:hypothetical protein
MSEAITSLNAAITRYNQLLETYDSVCENVESDRSGTQREINVAYCKLVKLKQQHPDMIIQLPPRKKLNINHLGVRTVN